MLTNVRNRKNPFKTLALTGVTNGVVSGVASMAASGGDSIRLSLARVKFLSPLMAVLIITFPDEMLLPKNKFHIRHILD